MPSPLARSGCSCIVLILVDVAPATTADTVFADAAALLLLLLLLLGKQRCERLEVGTNEVVLLEV